MSSFLPTLRNTFEFDGDQVEVTFKRPTRKHFLTLLPLIKKMNNEDGEVDQVAAMEMLEAAVPIIKECVVEFQGLEAADGTPMSFDDTIDEAFFTDLHSEMMGFLFESISAGGEKGN